MNGQSLRGKGRVLSLVGVLILAMVSTNLAAACGGGSDGGNGAGSTSTPTQQAASTQQPSSGNASLFLTAGNFDTVSVSLKAGDVLKVTYEAQSVIVGGGNVTNLAESGAVMAINDPVEDTVYRGDQKRADEVTLTAELDGMYEVIFQNPFPLQAQQVTVTYSINE
jgi:hypothetical protein